MIRHLSISTSNGVKVSTLECQCILVKNENDNFFTVCLQRCRQMVGVKHRSSGDGIPPDPLPRAAALAIALFSLRQRWDTFGERASIFTTCLNSTHVLFNHVFSPRLSKLRKKICVFSRRRSFITSCRIAVQLSIRLERDRGRNQASRPPSSA